MRHSVARLRRPRLRPALLRQGGAVRVQVPSRSTATSTPPSAASATTRRTVRRVSSAWRSAFVPSCRNVRSNSRRSSPRSWRSSRRRSSRVSGPESAVIASIAVPGRKPPQRLNCFSRCRGSQCEPAGLGLPRLCPPEVACCTAARSAYTQVSGELLTAGSDDATRGRFRHKRLPLRQANHPCPLPNDTARHQAIGERATRASGCHALRMVVSGGVRNSIRGEPGSGRAACTSDTAAAGGW